jgi:hypothetical protein
MNPLYVRFVNVARKDVKLWDFMFRYFPDTWLEVVKVAMVGNDKWNPGETMHWARDKSPDQMNSAFRHLWDYGSGSERDEDGCYHLAKAIWRLMAQLQLDIEKNDKPKRVDKISDVPMEEIKNLYYR